MDPQAEKLIVPAAGLRLLGELASEIRVPEGADWAPALMHAGHDLAHAGEPHFGDLPALVEAKALTLGSAVRSAQAAVEQLARNPAAGTAMLAEVRATLRDVLAADAEPTAAEMQSRRRLAAAASGPVLTQRAPGL